MFKNRQFSYSCTYSALERNCASKYHAYDVNNAKLADRSVCMAFITNFYCRSSRRRTLASSSLTPGLNCLFLFSALFRSSFLFLKKATMQSEEERELHERAPPRNNSFSASQTEETKIRSMSFLSPQAPVHVLLLLIFLPLHSFPLRSL